MKGAVEPGKRVEGYARSRQAFGHRSRSADKDSDLVPAVQHCAGHLADVHRRAATASERVRT